MEHLRKALSNCKYPKLAFDKVEKRLSRSSSVVNDGANSQGTTGGQPITNEVKMKGHIVIPYIQGLCESIKKICGRYGIQTHFKGNSTIKNLLVSPKEEDPMVNKSGAMYCFQCGDPNCNDEYIGKPLGPYGKDSTNTLRNPFLYIIIAITQAILPLNITSK